VWFGAWYAGVSVLAQLVLIAENYVAQDLAWAATNDLRTDLTRHCIKLGPTFFKDHSAGVMIERIDGDVSQLANFFSRFVASLVSNCLLMLGIIVALAFVDWRMAIALSLIPIIGLSCFKPLTKLARTKAKALREVQAEWVGFIEEHVRGREDIQTCGAIRYVTGRLHAIHLRMLRAACANSVVNTILWAVIAICYVAGYIVAIVSGAWLYYHRHISVGTAFLIFNYTIKLLLPLFTIGWQLQDLQQSLANIGRITYLFSVMPEVPEGSGPALPDGPLSVEFENVTFEYEPGQPVLSEVSFSLMAGETLAIIGPTGGGKSTITRLLFRFYDANKGVIRLGGVDIKRPRVQDLRHRIAMVSQDVQLFHGTLRDNITLFDPEVQDAVLLHAIEDLGLSTWFESLPDGLNSHLDGHDSLSAGEAQLVAFLRIYLKRPGLIIMDEVSSKMDPVTEARLLRTVRRLTAGRTVIVIAHRMEVVQSVNKILVIKNGQISDFDERVELENRQGSYYSGLLNSLTEATETS